MFIKVKIIGTRHVKDDGDEEFSDPLLGRLTGQNEVITEAIEAVINIEKVEDILTILPGGGNPNTTSVELKDASGDVVNYLFDYPFSETVSKFKKLFPDFKLEEF